MTDVLELAGRFIAACWVVFIVVWFIAAWFAKRTVERSGTWLRWIGVDRRHPAGRHAKLVAGARERRQPVARDTRSRSRRGRRHRRRAVGRTVGASRARQELERRGCAERAARPHRSRSVRVRASSDLHGRAADGPRNGDVFGHEGRRDLLRDIGRGPHRESAARGALADDTLSYST